MWCQVGRRRHTGYAAADNDDSEEGSSPEDAKLAAEDFGYPLVLLLIVNIMLVGRLLGLARLTSAFLWGLLLMLLAMAFFVAEAFVISHGALTLAGAVCFVLGSLLLFDPAATGLAIVVLTAVITAGATS